MNRPDAVMARFAVSILLLLQVIGVAQAAGAARELHWIDLLPESERQGFVPGPPPPLHGYLEQGRFPGGGDEFDVECLGVAARLSGNCSPAQRQSVSGRVNEQLDGQSIQLSGYVVPLEVGAGGVITEFFLAPYVGACIHVPPPAPNQLVHVKLPRQQRLEMSVVGEPLTVQGVLHARNTASALGAASYSLDVQAMQRSR